MIIRRFRTCSVLIVLLILVAAACGAGSTAAKTAKTDVRGKQKVRTSRSTSTTAGVAPTADPANPSTGTSAHGTSGGRGNSGGATGAGGGNSGAGNGGGNTAGGTTPPPVQAIGLAVWGSDGIYTVGPGGGGCSIANAVHSAGFTPRKFAVQPGQVITTSASGSTNTGLRNQINDVAPEGSYPVDAGNPDYQHETQINVSAANGLSGITGPRVGFMVGVFTGSGPVITTTNGSQYAYPYTPRVNEVFFVGNGANFGRSIVVPAGARNFSLGIADAWDTNAKTITGCPGYYDDNSGPTQLANQPNWNPGHSFNVTLRITG